MISHLFLNILKFPVNVIKILVVILFFFNFEISNVKKTIPGALRSSTIDFAIAEE